MKIWQCIGCDNGSTMEPVSIVLWGGSGGEQQMQASSYGKALYMAETQEKSDKGENFTFST